MVPSTKRYETCLVKYMNPAPLPPKPLPSNPTLDQIIDEGVAETFPASDPVAAAQPHAGERPAEPAALKPRSPHAADWMFRR
jgi:hypothetical protein